MLDRRAEVRTLCADKVAVRWKDRNGRIRRVFADLDDISRSGACLVVDRPIPLKSTLLITTPTGEIIGTVRHCVARSMGYVLGVHFDAGSAWSPLKYRPRHFDPRRLLTRSAHHVNPG